MDSSEGLGRPFEVLFCGKFYFVCTSRAPEAVRLVAMHLGATANTVSVEQVVKTLTVPNSNSRKTR